MAQIDDCACGGSDKDPSIHSTIWRTRCSGLQNKSDCTLANAGQPILPPNSHIGSQSKFSRKARLIRPRAISVTQMRSRLMLSSAGSEGIPSRSHDFNMTNLDFSMCNNWVDLESAASGFAVFK